MNQYSKIDMENWPRREHYHYYTKVLKIEYNMTVDIQVDPLLEFCRRNGYKFYPVFIWLVTKVVNQIENFKMFRDEQGDLCVWDNIVPNYTIFHEDDKTFSDCWSEYFSDFETFYQNITRDMERFKDKKGIKARDNQPGNFYCISCAPWVRFTAFNSRITNGEPQFFPIITAGKYEKTGEHTVMPVAVMIAHAVCDGYHAGLFFEQLQTLINELTGDGKHA